MGLNTFSYSDIIPPGSYLPIAWDIRTHPESSPFFPRGYLISDGRQLSGYVNSISTTNPFLFRRLYNYIGNLYGFGQDGISALLVSPGVIQLRVFNSGAAPAWVDVNTGFTFTVISTSPNRITQITPTAGGLITPGSYFYAFGTLLQYVAYMVVDGVGADPMIAGKISVPVPIFSTSTAEQIASRIGLQLSAVGFTLPYMNNGQFMRGILPGVNPAYDPDYATRLAYYAGGPTGTFPGSFQNNQVQNLTNTHSHGIAYQAGIVTPAGFDATTAGDGPAIVSGNQRVQFGLPSSTLPTTITLSAGSGNQTNPANSQWTLLIKY